jgi:hypothetical protein
MGVLIKMAGLNLKIIRLPHVVRVEKSDQLASRGPDSVVTCAAGAIIVGLHIYDSVKPWSQCLLQLRCVG